MDLKLINENAAVLTAELQWLARVINNRMQLFWQEGQDSETTRDISVCDLADDPAVYSQVVKHFSLNIQERLILLMALAPHIQPQLLDVFFKRNVDYDRPFTEFGGIKGHNHGGFIPTGETIAFLLAGNDFSQRFALFRIFDTNHFFYKFNILKLENIHPGEPLLSGVLRISSEYLNLLTLGENTLPGFSTAFPAKLVSTQLEWDDLVLDNETLEEVLEIRDWIIHGDMLINDWQLNKKIKPGFRTLFYGPPGTGKTLTASLLGKVTGLDVYRIDLSMVVSKYIGETEKNLANIFDEAENKRWILFFDEADALFGKRTQTSSANDRHANQEISYLLQRVEDFPGVVILATNLKANLDDAFSRRFQSMIYFASPGPAQRRQLWKKAFSAKTTFEPLLQQKLDEIATRYEMAGGAMINVVRYSSLMAIKRSENMIRYEDVMAGIRKEYLKEGKTI